MKICFPVAKDEGLSSTLYGHFGSAPLFLLYDTATSTITPIANRNEHHAGGGCSPMKAFNGCQVDAIVVGGIGAGAMAGLKQMGIRVHQAQAGTIVENMSLFTVNKLPEVTLKGCCSGHSRDGGCAH